MYKWSVCILSTVTFVNCTLRTFWVLMIDPLFIDWSSLIDWSLYWTCWSFKSERISFLFEVQKLKYIVGCSIDTFMWQLRLNFEPIAIHEMRPPDFHRWHWRPCMYISTGNHETKPWVLCFYNPQYLLSYDSKCLYRLKRISHVSFIS